MRSTGVARRHHTVPKFYLRGFAKDDQVTTVRLPGDKRFDQSVHNAAVQTDFYTVQGHQDGDDVVEKQLMAVENRAAAVFQKIVSGTWPLPELARNDLGYFIAFQAMRTPLMRRNAEHLVKEALRSLDFSSAKRRLRAGLDRDGIEIADERLEAIWAKVHRAGIDTLKPDRVDQINSMIEMSEVLWLSLLDRPWFLIEFARRSLITSDAPVSLIPDPKQDGAGYLTAPGITFPLTRRLGLFVGGSQLARDLGVSAELVGTGAADERQPGTTQIARRFNAATLQGASEWIFHHPEDASTLPANLPDPRPVTIRTSSRDEH